MLTATLAEVETAWNEMQAFSQINILVLDLLTYCEHMNFCSQIQSEFLRTYNQQYLIY
jgi:hypothetical protein